MALSDTKLRSLRAREKSYQIADGGGLFIEVMQGGKRVWRMRYWRDRKQEKVTFGEYPSLSLIEARQRREDAKAMIARGESPMRAKAEAKIATKSPDTVEAFSRIWLDDIVAASVKDSRNIRRVLAKDVFPTIGSKRLAEVTQSDVLSITDRIKARGADQMALHTRNYLKRLFSYAIARGKLAFNPAAAIEAKFIATMRSRDVALAPKEIGTLLRGIYASNLRRIHKLALHVLMLTMVRKNELIQAKWTEFDFKKAEWLIPGERMKKERPHIVYLPTQALAIFEELKALSSSSEWVLPSRGDLKRPISRTTLNQAIRTLDLELRDFVIHDFRRTASTHLHETGFNSDVIEKCLAHEQGGVRGVYNKAEYREQRKQVLQWWADFVDTQINEGRTVVIGRFGKVA